MSDVENRVKEVELQNQKLEDSLTQLKRKNKKMQWNIAGLVLVVVIIVVSIYQVLM